MPTMLIDEPLGITCVFSNGSRAEFSLDSLPNPQLARDLAPAWSNWSIRTAPRRRGQGQCTTSGPPHMVRTLASRGFTGGAGQLRPGHARRVLDGHHRPARPTRGHDRASPQAVGTSPPGCKSSRTEGTSTRSPPPALAALPEGGVGPPHRPSAAPGREIVRRPPAGPGRRRPRPNTLPKAAGQRETVRWLLAQVGPVGDRPLRTRPSACTFERRPPARGGDSTKPCRSLPAPGRDDRLPAAVRHLLRHRARRHRRPGHRRHGLGRGRHDPALLHQGPHGGGEPEPAAPGSAPAGAVAGALRAAAELPPPGDRATAVAVPQPDRGHRHRGHSGSSTRAPVQRWVERHGIVGEDGRTSEDPPGPDPHHPRRDAGQAAPGPAAAGPRSTPTTAPRSRATTT